MKIGWSKTDAALSHELGISTAGNHGHDKYHLENKAGSKAEGLYIPYGSGLNPFIRGRVTWKRSIKILSVRLTDYVYDTTPYLIIDYDLTGGY